MREICDREGIVFVADEVQTGFGRTGRMFAIEHFDVEPDLITVAKSIAGGPAALGRARQGGDHGRTRATTPSAAPTSAIRSHRLPRSPCSTSSRTKGCVERAGRIGETIRGRMSAWQERHPQIGDVRGLGAMLAIELVRDPATKEPAPELAARVAEEAARRGLLLLRAGVHSNCIRVLCPLVITDPELDEALDAWDEALEAVLA